MCVLSSCSFDSGAKRSWSMTRAVSATRPEKSMDAPASVKAPTTQTKNRK